MCPTSFRNHQAFGFPQVRLGQTTVSNQTRCDEPLGESNCFSKRDPVTPLLVFLAGVDQKRKKTYGFLLLRISA